MRLLLAVTALLSAASFAQHAAAQTSSAQERTKATVATYDPIVAAEVSLAEWVKIYPTIPPDKWEGAEIDHLLQRHKGEIDQAYSYRFYARYGTEKNLSRAKQMYSVLQKYGRSDSHRWLFVDEANDHMYFVDIRTATGGESAGAWFQVRKFGVLEVNEYWAFDCTGRRGQVKAVSTFNRDGSVKETSSIPTPWNLIQPSSVAEALFEFTCS